MIRRSGVPALVAILDSVVKTRSVHSAIIFNTDIIHQPQSDGFFSIL